MAFYRDKNMKSFWDHKENLHTFYKESLLYKFEDNYNAFRSVSFY